MKKWRYILICMGIGYLLSSCMSEYELMVKLYDETNKTEIQDPSNYEIISFYTKRHPNAIASSMLPQVWLGGGIPEPGRNLDLLKADEKGIFLETSTSATIKFMVVLNKEKSIIACYLVDWYRPGRSSNYPRKDDLYGREFFDVTCRDTGIGEEYIAPLYIEGSHPAYMLPSNVEFDDDGKLKNFFNIRG